MSDAEISPLNLSPLPSLFPGNLNHPALLIPSLGSGSVGLRHLLDSKCECVYSSLGISVDLPHEVKTCPPAFSNLLWPSSICFLLPIGSCIKCIVTSLLFLLTLLLDLSPFLQASHKLLLRISPSYFW